MTRSPKKILHATFTNPAGYPSLEFGADILSRAGWEVRFLGIHVRGVEDIDFPPHLAARSRLWRAAPRGWRGKLRFLAFQLRVLLWALLWRPRWVYLSDPLVSPVGVALTALGVSVVYHEHDAPGPATSPWQRFLLATRRRLGTAAALVVIPNHQRLSDFLAETNRRKPSLCVWNCPGLRDIPESLPPRPDSGLRMIYRGSINEERLPLTILDAMAALKAPSWLSIIGYWPAGSGDYRHRFLTRARELGLEEHVRIVGVTPRRELPPDLTPPNVGLALFPRESDDYNQPRMAGASNKVFEYLAGGLIPLITDAPQWRDLLEGERLGVFCDPRSGESLVQALAWIQEHPAEIQAMRERGHAKCRSEWNYEFQFQPVKRMLEGESRPS